MTTMIMALVASLLYIFYQPVVYSVFLPINQSRLDEGTTVRDKGLGLRGLMDLPIP